MISHRFVRAVSLLTIALFLLSASVNETLHQLENLPSQSQLAIYSPAGHLQAVYHGNLTQLSADAAAAPQPGFLPRVRATVEHEEL